MHNKAVEERLFTEPKKVLSRHSSLLFQSRKAKNGMFPMENLTWKYNPNPFLYVGYPILGELVFDAALRTPHRSLPTTARQQRTNVGKAEIWDTSTDIVAGSRIMQKLCQKMDSGSRFNYQS